jgi:uncharacterized protein with ParB-like and HNH nuclease domain
MCNPFKSNLENLDLSKLLKKKLKIPEYQRYYTWETSHVLDLLKDIFDRETPYLMGTVILHKNNDDLDIVDGQQRLVTLTIMLRELNSNLDKKTPCSLLEAPCSLLKAKFSESSARSIIKSRDVIHDFFEIKSDDEKEKFCKRLLHQDNNDGLLIFTVLTIEGDNALDRAFTFFNSIIVLRR